MASKENPVRSRDPAVARVKLHGKTDFWHSSSHRAVHQLYHHIYRVGMMISKVVPCSKASAAAKLRVFRVSAGS